MIALAHNDTALKQWKSLVTTCFRRRIRADQLSEAFHEQWSRQQIPGASLVTLILESGSRSTSGIDPLIPAYLDEVLKVTSVDICDILVSLLARSRFALKNATDQASQVSSHDELLIQESVFAMLLRLVVGGDRPKTVQESRRAVRALMEWFTAFNYHEAMLQVQSDGLRTLEPGVVSSFETLGAIATSLFTNDITRNDISKSASKDLKDKLALAVGNFAASLTQWSSSQVPTRLAMIARTPPLTSEKPDFTMAEIASAVVDLPISNTRTGLYIYLNAALCARPLIDDMSLFNYLHARYGSDSQLLVTDLIVASFDTLANALHRHEPAHNIICYRSFIANKLPLLLLSLSASLFPPLTAQLCIQMALGRIDIHPFPPLQSGNDAINEVLKLNRQEFLQACVLHRLGSESSFTSIIGDFAGIPPSRTVRYTKDLLVGQFTANVHRVEQLASELANMQGNAGAISGALVETLQQFCDVKETMSLRALCNSISRRLPFVDIVLQYTQPSDLLLPLCNILNEWIHDEDQSEFQPPYEDFASILLLVLAVVHRYNLSESDIGLSNKDNFVSKLLARLSDSIPVSELTQDQNRHLEKWMHGLYATDEHGETSGISDETMSHCPPQEFYLLAPTLFEQSILGCRANALALDTLKGGLEFLLEPFLLPSLIGGLSWITKHSWEDHGDADVLIQVLQKLLRPSSISGDAQAMHQTILSMIASPLERSLRELARRLPNRQDISSLLEVLKPHLNSRRSTECNIVELNRWSSASGGGLRYTIHSVLQGLVMWTNQVSMNPIPTNYTHFMILAGLDLLGADDVLQLIVEEIRDQSQGGFGPAAIETGTSIVCAPTPVSSTTLLDFNGNPVKSSGHRRTLRQALKHKLEAPTDLLELETEYVEALVRLGRRVDAQSTIPSMNPIGMPVGDLGSHDLMQDIGMAGTEVGGDDLAMQQASELVGEGASDFGGLGESLDLSATGTTLDGSTAMQVDLPDNLFGSGQDLDFNIDGDASQSQAGNASASFGGQSSGNGMQNGEEDIFAGLDMGDMGDDDFNFG